MVHKFGMDESIVDICRYRKPDLSIIDGAIGQEGSHTSGYQCRPPKRVIIAGEDSIEVDKVGANILGFDWRQIRHIVLAEKVLK